VVGDRIYTIGDRGDSSFVIALSVTDGKEAWAAKLGKAGAPGWGGFEGPRAAPTVDTNLIFALGQWGELACFDPSNGAEQWRKSYESDFGGKRPEWGFADAPLVDGNALAATPGGSKGAIVALNKRTGALLWRSSEFTDEAHYSSLVPADFGGVHQYVQLTPRNVVGVAAANGKVLWKASRKGDVAVIPTPIVADDHVYVTSGYGNGCDLFRISGTQQSQKADRVYSNNKVMVNHHGGAVKAGDYVYGYSDGKGWTCQEFKTGEAKWQEKDKLGKGSLVYADSRLYLRQEDRSGTVALIEASPAGYKEHGRFEQPERSQANSWAHPVVANGKLYLRDQDLLLCYDVSSKPKS
jgi:outer membrane protein assembly factor BamB